MSHLSSFFHVSPVLFKLLPFHLRIKLQLCHHFIRVVLKHIFLTERFILKLRLKSSSLAPPPKREKKKRKKEKEKEGKSKFSVRWKKFLLHPLPIVTICKVLYAIWILIEIENLRFIIIKIIHSTFFLACS